MTYSNKKALGSGAFLIALSAPLCADDLADQPAHVADVPDIIEEVQVYGISGARYRASHSGDARRLSELADTPQTMSVLTQAQLRDSGKTDLKEILAAQAGITLGTGENGNAFGDRYVIRGHEARSDVFVDGIRDPGMTTRESFATEQVEITKGPSSTFAGRGSSGGAVNSITKSATAEQDFGLVDVAAGTDEYHRVTLDTNVVLGADTALRLNVLDASEEAPDRSGIESERRGALLSGLHAFGPRLQTVVDAYYLEANDVPDLGSYFDRDMRKPIENIPVYAQANDFLDTEVLALTARTHFELTDDWRGVAALRWGTTDNGYITTGVRGSTRTETDPLAPGAATMSLSTHQGWQEVGYSVAQLNLFRDFDIAGRSSRWVFGLEYTDEAVDNGVYDITDTGTPNCVVSGRGGDVAGYCITDGNGNTLADIDSLIGREFSRGALDAQFAIETVSAYAMQTLELAPDWELFAGVRLDSFDYRNDVVSRGEAATFEYSDTLTNGHVGLVYKLTDEGRIYASYSTASNINGGESDVGGSCGYGGLCGDPDQVAQSNPERVENIEFGTKWEFFDDRLLATAAVFQITKSDVMESVGDAYSALGTLNTGKNRVEGVEVSLTGAITDQLSIQLSAAKMNSEVLASINPENEGLALSNFAEDSVFVMLRYEPMPALALGGSWTYQGKFYGGQPDTAAGYDPEAGQYSVVVPSYGVFDLFAQYDWSDSITLRLNANNIADEEYWTAAYRSGTFMYLGDRRSLRASVSYAF